MPRTSWLISKAPWPRMGHSFSVPGGLINPHHSPWTPPGYHHAVRPCGIGKFVFANASSIVLSRRWSSLHFRRHAAPFKSRAPMSNCSWYIAVRTAYITFFAILRFLDVVVEVERHHGEAGFTIAKDTPEWRKRYDGLKYPTCLTFPYHLLPRCWILDVDRAYWLNRTAQPA